MNNVPTKNDIQEKYKDELIGVGDFEIITLSELPNPFDLQQEGAWLKNLGMYQGVNVLLKYTLTGIAAIIIILGSLYLSLECINKSFHITYKQINPLVQIAVDNPKKSATEYIVALPDNLLSQLEEPDYQPTTTTSTTTTTTTTTSTTTSTTTTTTTMPPNPFLPIGSALVPYSKEWGGLA